MSDYEDDDENEGSETEDNRVGSISKEAVTNSDAFKAADMMDLDEGIVILGYTTSGHLCIMNSVGDEADINWMLDQAKAMVLSGLDNLKNSSAESAADEADAMLARIQRKRMTR